MRQWYTIGVSTSMVYRIGADDMEKWKTSSSYENKSSVPYSVRALSVRFLVSIDGNLEALQAAIAEAAVHNSEPAGVLKVSMSPSIGLRHILPLLPPFLAKYPRITPEWHFENRPVDLIGENYDAGCTSS